MNPFNAWDIMVDTSGVVNATYSVIYPQSLSINGNVLANYGTVDEVINCVNGGVGIATGQAGNIGCTIDDGPGRVHSAAVLERNLSPTISGLLFNITYKAIQGPGAALVIFNDKIANGTPSPLVYDLQIGNYGSPPPGFFMDINPKLFSVLAGGWRRADLVLTSYGGFNGNMDLNASILPSPDATMIFTPKTLTFTSGITLTSVMNVTTTLNARIATYLVKVNATGGGVTHAITVTVVISPAAAVPIIQDFSASTQSATVGDKLTVKATIANTGTIPGPPVTLIVVWQGFVVTNHTITLSPNQSKAYSDTWDTTGYPPANATLQAQIPNQARQSLPFNLAGPPPIPFYLDPLFLGILVIAVGAPSFLYIRHRGQRKAKRPH